LKDLFFLTIFICLYSVVFCGQLHAQKGDVLVFSLQEGKPCSSALEDFRSLFSIRVAFDPALRAHTSPFSITLRGNTPEEVFAKLCEVYRLEYIFSDKFSYLVRSTFHDISASKMQVHHLHIKEVRDGSPIAFATIFDKEKNFIGFTDAFGDCIIHLPDTVSGKSLIIHSLAHLDKEIRIGGGTTQQNLSLADDPVIVKPVKVTSARKQLSTLANQSTGVSSKLLDVIMLSSVFPSDVARSIQLLPGVKAIDDAKSGIRIRGSNEEATLLMLDQMPVYKADHFFGLFGAFNARYVHYLQLYKNNIPVEFGGRTSGMLYLESDAAASVTDVKVEANLLYSSVTANVPLSKRWLFKVAGRKSYTNLAKGGLYDLTQRNNIGGENLPPNLQNLITSRPSFDFFDGNARLLYHNGKHQADLNYFGSGDHFSDQFSSTYKIRQNTISDETFSQSNSWQNTVVGLNYKYTDALFEVRATGYFSRNASQYDITSFLLRKEPGILLKDTVEVYNQNTISDAGMKASIHFGKERNMYAGIEYVHHTNYLFIENERFPIFEINRTGDESSTWGGMRIGRKTAFFADPAIRLTRLHPFGKFYFLPQIYLSQSLGDGWLAKASAGRHLQFVRQFDHENPLGQKQQFFVLSNGTTVPVAIGENTMLGIWKSLGNFVIDIEGYYRWLNGSTMHAAQMPGLRLPGNAPLVQGFKLYQGQARTAGVDLSLIYEKSNVFSMFTYTLSKTENRFDGVFGRQWFPATEDSRHQLKWVNAYTYAKMDVNFTYIGATGRPYIDLSSLDKSVDRSTLDPTKYVKKLTDYHRFDVGMTYHLNILGMKARLGCSVFNIFNRTNVKYRQFFFRLPPGGGPGNPGNALTSIGSDVSQLERTFNVSLLLHFTP
jgi:ferric enterobactin receptor